MNQESWHRLTKAAKYYESKGFVYADVPWAVDPQVTALTKPSWCNDFPLGNKVLVGSAEQSFLQKWLTFEKYKMYYAITPCFRDEREEDNLHRPYFMKLELFSFDTSKFINIYCHAWHFFHSEGNKLKLGYEVLGENSVDILLNGIEIGSYSVQEREGLSWTCGTGLAEPRFSEAIKL